MHSQEQSLSSLFRTISLVVIATLVMMLAMAPAWAQNSVPPTAVQAARMPEFASRLAHPVKRPGPPTSPALARARMHRGPLDSNDIYDNGPINGNTDAWTINFGFIVSDSFNVVNNNSSITGMSFGAWLFAGDTLTSAEVSITSGENGGTSYFDQTVNFTQGTCTVNQYGYNICTEPTSFNAPNLNAGTYWVNLQNATVPSGDPIYWDENSGVGCTGSGCPSLASDSSIGTIPSEAFTILGSATTTTSTSTTIYNDYACPGPQPGFHDLRDFSSNAGPSGLAIDTAGKLYGTFANGGSYGAGLLYDFAQRAGHWFLTSLYSFLGGSSGGSPGGVIVGPGGALYGSAVGGSYGYGLIYKATPPSTVCTNALCSWNETTIYEFTSGTDAFGVTAFDSAGNLYGIGSGGAYGQGAVFELTPLSGGWTEQILYSFTGGSDGGGPNSLLVGHDGNLYGTAGAGGNNDCGEFGGPCGVVFQLVPSGSGWTENVIYAFTGAYTDGWDPSGLIQDSQGNLYGVDVCFGFLYGGCYPYEYFRLDGVIFGLSRSGGGWEFGQIHTYETSECPLDSRGDNVSAGVTYHALTLDPGGILYATEGGGTIYFCGQNCYIEVSCGGIWSRRSGTVVSGAADIFGNITSDANGNLYGTTNTCGFGTSQRTDGMVWEYSP